MAGILRHGGMRRLSRLAPERLLATSAPLWCHPPTRRPAPGLVAVTNVLGRQALVDRVRALAPEDNDLRPGDNRDASSDSAAAQSLCESR